jgi:dTDP-4-amino-4,6-dideoxygalactose transaminase
MIGFNKPHITGNEFQYIEEAISQEKLSGNGIFTRKCQDFFSRRYGFKKTLLTHSGTGALEMTALLIDIQPGDEVIMPSYTFVSTANAFLLYGANVIFADSSDKNPNMDVSSLRSLITARTKAIVVVHYAGVACDMDPILELAREKNLFVIEDAAQAIDSYYKDRPLGSLGHLAAFSFHETKNIISGEGGMLVINDERFIERSEILWEKGTNRSAFFRGEIDKYTWIDKGSSFLPSELTAAFLFAQLECIGEIQEKRKKIWEHYFDHFDRLKIEGLGLPFIDSFATNNAHMFYILTRDLHERDALLATLKSKDIQAIFHYVPLHTSPYYKKISKAILSLPRAEKYGDCLIRLPFYIDLTLENIDYIVGSVASFYHSYQNQNK